MDRSRGLPDESGKSPASSALASESGPMPGRPPSVQRIAIGRWPVSPILGRLLALLVVAIPEAAYARGLAPEERHIADSVDDLREEPIGFLDRVVDIDSATQDLDGVRKVCEAFRAEFGRLGFETS